MNTDWQVVDLIERASDARPFCACGQHTTTTWRDGTVWLECASLLDPPVGRLDRLVRFLTTPAHTTVRIVDVPAAEPGPGVLIGGT